MIKRTVAWVLCMVMLCSMLPVPALASTLPPESLPVPEETSATETFAPESEPPSESTAETEVPAETKLETEPAEKLLPVEETASADAMAAASEVKNEQYIQQCYESTSLSGFDLDAHVVLENDYTVPDDKLFDILEDASITIPSGKTLTLGNGATVYGSILVESGGTLMANWGLDIHGSVILESGAVVEMPWFGEVREGGLLWVKEGARFALTSSTYDISCYPGGTITMDGTFEHKKSYPVDTYYEDGVYGNVIGVPVANQMLICNADDTAEFLDCIAVMDNAGYRDYCIQVHGPVSLSTDTAIPDGCEVNFWTGASLTVQSGCTLVNGGDICSLDLPLQNDGTIESYGDIDICEGIVNNGTITMYEGVLTVRSSTYMTNNGTVYAYGTTNIAANGTWDGDEYLLRVRNEEYLREILSAGDTWPDMDSDVVLENDFTISGGSYTLNVNATLTVPAGKTLTLQDATLFVNNGGGIVVEEGGTLVLNGWLSCWRGSRVINRGTMYGYGNILANYEEGQFVTETQGIPYDLLRLRCMVNNDADLQDAVQVMKDTNYVFYVLLVHGDIDLSADLTIPENARLLLTDTPSTMTIPADRKVINYGSVEVYEDQTIHNLGTFENNGQFNTRGTVINDGVFHAGYGLNDMGTWEGNPPICAPMTQAELEKAMSEAGRYYQLNAIVTLERNLTVRSNLAIGANGHLIVPKGIQLTVEADSYVTVEPGGQLDMNGTYVLKKNADGWSSAIGANTYNGELGTVNGVKDADLQISGFVYDSAHFSPVLQAVADHPGSNYNFLYIFTDVELPSDTVIPENCIAHLYDGAILTIPSGKTLTNLGEFYCWQGQSVNNSGTIENQGFFLVSGSFENNGHMNLRPGSYLVVDGPGYVNNAGSIDAHALDVTDIFGSLEGNPINYLCISQAEFEQMIADAAASDGIVTLNKTVTLERNLMIPETVQLDISGGSIVVPSDKVLMLNCRRTDVNNGGILVREGGKLNLGCMIFVWYNGVVQVDGSFTPASEWQRVVSTYENGLYPCTVEGIPMESQRMHVVLHSQSEFWQPGIELFENNNYGITTLSIQADVTLPKDLTIPENGYLHMEGPANINLIIPEGTKLINNGQCYINEARSLYNYGTIENRGYLYVRGNLFNHGTMDFLPSCSPYQESLLQMPQYGYVLNQGTASFHAGSRLDNQGWWDGTDPVWKSITQEQLEAGLAAAAERGETYRLNTGVVLERNLTLAQPMIIGSSGYLQVPTGVTLNLKALLNIFAGGQLDVKGKYTVSGDGQVGIRYENGHFSSQAIGIQNKDLWVNMLVLSDTDLRNGVRLMETGGYGLGSLAIYESFALTGDITIPANTIVPMENGSMLTIPAGCTLTNNGEIYIWPGQTLQNDGVIRNNNCLRIGDGRLVNNGTLELTGAAKADARNPRLIINPGVMENNGTVTMAKNSYIEMYGTWVGPSPLNNGGRIYPQAQSLTIEGGENHLIDIRRTDSITLQVTQPGAVFRNAVWISSNSAVVDAAQIIDQGNGTYCIPVKGVGKAKLTATAIDGTKLTDFVNLEAEWADWSPRLGSKTLSLNPQLTTGTQVALIPSYGNAILSCRLEDDRFTVDYDAAVNILTVTAPEEVKNATVSTVLNVECADGETYSYPVKITVKNAQPAVTVKQTGKMDLFYTDSQAGLTVTAKNAVVTALALEDTLDFTLEEGVLGFSEQFVMDYQENPLLKPDTKATLYVYLEGYRFPVIKAITIGTTTSKLTLTTDPAATTVHSALSADRTAAFRILNKTTKQPLALQSGDIQRVDAAFVSQYQVVNGGLSLDITGETGGTAGIYVRLDNWMQPVKLTHKVTVNSKLPTAKASVATLKLSSFFPRQTAETAVILSHGNLDIAHFTNGNTFVSTAKEGSAARVEAAKLEVVYDGTSIVARIKDPDTLPKAGTYTFTAVPVVADTELKAVTVKVNVSSALPKVKLSSSTVKLNTLLSGTETGILPVTLNHTTGYDLQVSWFKGMDTYSQIHMNLEEDGLQICLGTQREGTYPFTLIPVVTDDTGTAVELAPVKLTVQTYRKDVTVAQSGKGSLDAIDRSSKIQYTISRITNALGPVESVELAAGSEWFAISPLDTDAKGKQVFSLTLKEDAAVSTKETYAVQFRYQVCGRSVLSGPIKLKIKQSALKVTAPAVTYYLSQQSPMTVSLTPTAPAGAAIAGVSINPAKTTKALLDAIGSVDVSWGRDVVMNLEIRYPGNLTYGKSYKLVLDVTPAGHAAGAKETQITVTVKVAK